MSSDVLLDAIGMIDDDLVADAKTAPRVCYLKRIMAVAACLSLAITAAAYLISPGYRDRGLDRIMITSRIEAQFPGQGYAGNWAERNNDSTMTLAPVGVVATVKAIEVLPDAYSFYPGMSFVQEESEPQRLRLVKMQTVNVLCGKNMVNTFLFGIREELMTDFLTYDLLLIKDMVQFGCENSVLYNQTTGQAEALELPVFGNDGFIPRNTVVAFTNEEFDEDLWQNSDHWQLLNSDFIDSLDSPDDLTVVQRGWMLPQVESAMLQLCAKDERYSNVNVNRLSDMIASPVAEALTYVKPFVNGTFVPQLNYSLDSSAVSIQYRRYVNGYPTNETVTISGNSAAYSSAKFTQSQLQALPDLTSALYAIGAAVEAGEVSAPHFPELAGQGLEEYAIFGWYVSTQSGVYGVIRVDLNFGPGLDEDLCDDKYYIIAANSDVVEAIDRDKLLNLLGDAHDYVYTGAYGESGKPW